MTHEELLAKIGEPTDEGYEYCDIIFNKALRAVAELHKPNQIPKALWCTECSKRFENSGWYEPYPCPTIRAIEEQLK